MASSFLCAGEGPPSTTRGRRVAMHTRRIVLLEIVHDELQVKTESVHGQQNEDCEHTGVVDGSTMPNHVLPKLSQSHPPPKLYW